MTSRIRKTLIIVALLALFFGVPWYFLKRKDQVAWEDAQERARQAGISLNIQDYKLPDVPPKENFLLHPDFAPEWNGLVIPKLDRWHWMEFPEFKSYKRVDTGKPHKGIPSDARMFFEEELTEAEALDKLLKIMTPIDQRLTSLVDIILSYPQRDLAHSKISGPLSALPTDSYPFVKQKRLAHALSNRATFAIQAGNTDQALLDILAHEKLTRSLGKGLVISYIIRHAMHGLNDSTIWEGLRTRSWKKRHLLAIKELLEKRAPLKDADEIVKMCFVEPISIADGIKDYLKAFNQGPSGGTITEQYEEWQETRKATKNPTKKKAMLGNSLIDILVPPRTWTIDRIDELEKLDAEITDEFGEINTPRADIMISNTFECDTRTRITRIAVALELFFIEHGDYPASLKDLPNTPPLLDLSDPKKRNIEYHLSPTSGRPELTSPADPEIHWRYTLSPREQAKAKARAKKKSTRKRARKKKRNKQTSPTPPPAR